MNTQVFDEFKRATTPSNNLEQLRIEREFRFFLLHLLDSADQNIDMINAVSPIYQSEIMRLNGMNHGQKENEFKKILDLFMNGDEPVNIAVQLSQDERRTILLALLPDIDELHQLRRIIESHDIPTPLFSSLAYTFAFYKNIDTENAALEKRLQTIRDVRHFTPNYDDVFIPKNPTSNLSTPRSHALSSSARSKTSLGSYSYIKSQVRSNSHAKPKMGSLTPRIRSALNTDQIKTTKYIPNQPTPISFKDMNNSDLRTLIESREKHKQTVITKVNRIKDSIETKFRDISYLQKEIASLEQQLSELENEEKAKIQQNEDLDVSHSKNLSEMKKEANEITMKLRDAIKENQKLKELEEQEKQVKLSDSD